MQKIDCRRHMQLELWGYKIQFRHEAQITNVYRKKVSFAASVQMLQAKSESVKKLIGSVFRQN